MPKSRQRQLCLGRGRYVIEPLMAALGTWVSLTWLVAGVALCTDPGGWPYGLAIFAVCALCFVFTFVLSTEVQHDPS